MRDRALDADDSITIANTEEMQSINKNGMQVQNYPHRKIKQ